MKPQHRPAIVLAILVGASLLSYASWTGARWLEPRVTGSIVIVIALAKVWIIGMRYMELGEAAPFLRIIYGAWVFLVGTMPLTMFALAA